MTTGYDHFFGKCLFLTYLTTQIVMSVAGADVISYTCSSSNEIENIVANPSIPASRILIKMSSGNLCPYSNSTCKDNNKKSSLNIVIQDDTNDNGLFAGRFNKYYSIECKKEYDVEESAGPMHVGTVPTLTPVVIQKPEPDLTLTLFNKNFKLGDSEQVFVGEELKLEMASQGYKVYPQSCTAINSGYPSDPVVKIWTFKEDTTDTHCSTYDKAITTEKWTLKKSANTISIPIYAFRFMTSTSVTIKCSAHLCALPDGICSPIRKTCMDEITRKRRRRSSGNSTKENRIGKMEEAHISFSVLSENIVQNKANDVSVCFTAVLTTIMFGRFFLRF